MADHLPETLTRGLDVRRATSVSGGDIALAYRLETADGTYFLKTKDRPTPDLFEREAAGLAVLREHAPDDLGVPQVVRADASGLVLEWIDEGGAGRAGRGAEERFGRGLAGLHRATHDTFGAIDDALAGYLGSAQVDLTPTRSWREFFVGRRVRPLTERAVREGRIDPVALQLVDELAGRADELCGPPEPPALVHGDLWAGNRLVDKGGRSWLIDPAAHWGHREYDLAMMQLFGGFGEECYRAYDEAFPLAEGWRERIAWHQLPPLLVHAILFGGGYGASALRVMRSYA
ncbi:MULTISPECIES: fructosamine kinase family protein [Arsenicicoccus]|uniref:fructosamine kinase family protein n=1 Tax=Arsenicicoccus TaxID=267408 RepID=UPI00257F6D26|nr:MULTISPECIES: fructosamine kinase family protein [Arsenicicoccus]